MDEFDVLFEGNGVGVFTHHEDEDAACRHVDLLLAMNGKKGTRWTITHQGEEIRSSKPKTEPKAS